MDHGDGVGLLRIGEFSGLSRISVRMLRHYQDKGILDPQWVDPFSGNRYYAAAQLSDARRIGLLRDAGFSVAQMGAVLASLGDSSSVAALIEAHRERLQSQRDEVEARSVALDHVEASLKESIMTIPVTTTTLPSMTVAALRDTIPSYADEQLLWSRLVPVLGAAGASMAPAGPAGATFYDEDYRETDVDVEVWVAVTGPFDAPAPVECRDVPEQRVASATLRGSYAHMSAVTTAIGEYVAANGLRTGPMFCIYTVSPSQDPNPDNWVTEVCYPIIVD